MSRALVAIRVQLNNERERVLVWLPAEDAIAIEERLTYLEDEVVQLRSDKDALIQENEWLASLLYEESLGE